jgi:hypothetical protein
MMGGELGVKISRVDKAMSYFKLNLTPLPWNLTPLPCLLYHAFTMLYLCFTL